MTNDETGIGIKKSEKAATIKKEIPRSLGGFHP